MRKVTQAERGDLVPPVRNADDLAAAQVTQAFGDHAVRVQPEPARRPGHVDARPIVEPGTRVPGTKGHHAYPGRANGRRDRLAEVRHPGLARRVRRPRL